MPYSVSDPGPAGYDLQQQGLRQEKLQNLLRLIMSNRQMQQAQGQWQAEQDLAKQKFGLEQQKFQSEEPYRRALTEEALSRAVYYTTPRTGNPSDFEDRLVFAQKIGLFNGDLQHQAAWAANPNYTPPKTPYQIGEEEAARERARVKFGKPSAFDTKKGGLDALLTRGSITPEQYASALYGIPMKDTSLSGKLADALKASQEQGIPLTEAIASVITPASANPKDMAQGMTWKRGGSLAEKLGAVLPGTKKQTGAVDTGGIIGKSGKPILGAVSKKQLSNGSVAYMDAGGKVIGIED